MTHFRRWGILYIITLGILSVPVTTIASAQANQEQAVSSLTRTDLKPMHPQPTATNLRPGLQTVYFFDFFARDIRKLPTGEVAKREGRPGKPILQLNHQFDRENVFDSGTNRGVGIRMSGALFFGQSGEYLIQALSNDGIQLYLDNQLLLSDPKQHADRLSAAVPIMIDTPGWYSLVVEYFQRKGTAALKLFWQRPGTDELEVVPATAYGHIQTP